jgi:hypothetical protein
VTLRPSLPSRERLIRLQIGKLEDCDETLALIASDVTALQEEVARLKAEADQLVRRLSASEHARREASERADAFSASLEEAEARLSRSAARAAELERERDGLLASVEDSQHRVAGAEAEAARLQDAPPERERWVEEERYRTTGGLVRRGPDERAIKGHLRVVALSDGYLLSPSDDPCSLPGDLVEVDGMQFVVSVIGRSPLPGDLRPCAFLVPRST